MLSSIIFDMDGTLFQTDTILELALDETFEHLCSMNKWEGATPIDKYREIMGVPLPKVWETLLSNHSSEERRYTDQYFLKVLIDNIERGNGSLYPNVKEVFDFLKEQGLSIYIASNGLQEYLNAIIRYYDLDKWVTKTFSIQQIDSLNKSDLVKCIVEKYNIKDAAVVGDRLSDINAAKDNDLHSIGCNFDFANENELSHADFVINDLIELKTLILRLNKSYSLRG